MYFLVTSYLVDALGNWMFTVADLGNTCVLMVMLVMIPYVPPPRAPHQRSWLTVDEAITISPVARTICKDVISSTAIPY